MHQIFRNRTVAAEREWACKYMQVDQQEVVTIQHGGTRVGGVKQFERRDKVGGF